MRLGWSGCWLISVIMTAFSNLDDLWLSTWVSSGGLLFWAAHSGQLSFSLQADGDSAGTTRTSHSAWPQHPQNLPVLPGVWYISSTARGQILLPIKSLASAEVMPKRCVLPPVKGLHRKNYDLRVQEEFIAETSLLIWLQCQPWELAKALFYSHVPWNTEKLWHFQLRLL